VNTAIQMMSSACQNSAKHRMRRWMSGPEPFCEHLRHYRQQPQDAGRDVQPMAAHQREECDRKRAARRPGAACNEAGEFIAFNREEAEAEERR